MRFEPIYQYRLWDGPRLANLLSAPLPNDGPLGEAWILSDREDHASQIANGSLKGQTLCQLEVDQALACIDFVDGAAGLVTPVVEAKTPVERARVFQCEPFRLWRLRGQSHFAVGAEGAPRVLVCIEGRGQAEHNGDTYMVQKGEVWLLPAVVGVCTFRPKSIVSLLEIAIPEEPGSGKKQVGSQS